MFASTKTTTWRFAARRHLWLAIAGAWAGGACSSADRTSNENAEPVQTTALAATTWAKGSWVKIANYPLGSTSGPIHLQLLMDGTVLANDSGSVHNAWRRFVPSPTGGYKAGTWTTTPVFSNYGRQFYASGILADGRVFAGGGEDAWDSNNNPITSRNTEGSDPDNSHCELFDPRANGGAGVWTNVPDFPTPTLGDGMLAPLPDGSGRLLVAPAWSTTSYIFDPNNLSNPWTNSKAIASTDGNHFDEGSLALMQNNNIFFGQTTGWVYDTSNNNTGWTTLTTPPGYKNPFDAVNLKEGAPALTLYDGTVFISSVTTNNALFTPSSSNPLGGTLKNVAVTPRTGGRMDENDQVVLANGNVFASVIGPSFNGGYKFYEWEPPPANQFHDVSASGPNYAASNLVATPLPDGSVLVANSGSNVVYIYTPQNVPFANFGQPAVSELTGPINGIYTLTGTTLNGLTNGANRDDEGQNWTSFPIISLQSGTTNVYASVLSVSTTSIAPNTFGRVYFKLPTGAPSGALTLKVAASGLPSSNSLSLNNNGNPVVAGPPQRGFLVN